VGLGADRCRDKPSAGSVHVSIAVVLVRGSCPSERVSMLAALVRRKPGPEALIRLRRRIISLGDVGGIGERPPTPPCPLLL
jgi:hypothetical protein